MKNDLVLIYPPLNNYYLDDLNKTDSNNKKYIEINLYKSLFLFYNLITINAIF